MKWAVTGVPQIMSRRKVQDLMQARWVCSWEKARRVLGYEPRWGLEEGLKATAAWYAEKGWIGRGK